MKYIVVLSDTHGLLRPEVCAELVKADAVLHAGDINTPAVAAQIAAYQNAVIVRGNNDKEWAQHLPHTARVTIEGVRFFIVHHKKDVPQNLADTDVIVYGHSHTYACEEKNGVLWLNPGSCGKRRFQKPLTFCKMFVENGTYTVEPITISVEEKQK